MVGAIQCSARYGRSRAGIWVRGEFVWSMLRLFHQDYENEITVAVCRAISWSTVSATNAGGETRLDFHVVHASRILAFVWLV